MIRRILPLKLDELPSEAQVAAIQMLAALPPTSVIRRDPVVRISDLEVFAVPDALVANPAAWVKRLDALAADPNDPQDRDCADLLYPVIDDVGATWIDEAPDVYESEPGYLYVVLAASRRGDKIWTAHTRHRGLREARVADVLGRATPDAQ